MLTSTSVQPMTRGVGYLYFMGYLQIGVGVLTIAFSALGIIQGLSSFPGLLSPSAVLDSASGWLVPILWAYMSFQISFGWIFGLLMIVAGVCCLLRRTRGFVATAAWMNLANFPHGTTAAIMMLHGLSRPGIAGAFEDAPSRE